MGIFSEVYVDGMVTIFRDKSVDMGMSVQKRKTRRTLGTYTVVENGNSKALNCVGKAEAFDIPTDIGDELTVDLVEDGDDVHLEVFPAEK